MHAYTCVTDVVSDDEVFVFVWYCVWFCVWDMCDAAHSAAGEVKDWKLFKKGIIVAGIVEGINESTVSVQFGKWKLASGF